MRYTPPCGSNSPESWSTKPQHLNLAITTARFYFIAIVMSYFHKTFNCMQTKDVQTIHEYIAKHPKSTQRLLKQMRSTIRALAPQATEVISYGIPTFKLNGNLVHFAGYKNHIGFYPGSAPLVAFKDDLKPYKTSKGSIQFPLDKPLPRQLIQRIVRFCVKRNTEKRLTKKSDYTFFANFSTSATSCCSRLLISSIASCWRASRISSSFSSI